MQFYSSLIKQSIRKIQESTLGTLRIQNPSLRKHLEVSFQQPLGSNESFLSEPVFEQTFGWKVGDTPFKELEGKPFCKSFLQVLGQAENYGFSGEMFPYAHQLEAWEALTAQSPKSAIITSGTGSGKTECFMMPILNDLILEYEASGKSPLKGVRALFLYPLNALINSQRERLHEWTSPYKEGIRFALYNGNTAETKYSVRREQKEQPNQIFSRELLRESPAPILLTNATMLEYMLVRQQDAPIIQYSKENKTLRWIVLDEAHTYIGSQAAEISLLLRRVVQAFGVKAQEIRFVATSATIAGDDAKKELQEFLASLAGVNTSQVVVITGDREWEELEEEVEEGDSLDLEGIRRIDPESSISSERYQALATNPISRRLRTAIVEAIHPPTLNDLVATLKGRRDVEPTLHEQQVVLLWLDLMTATFRKKDGEPFLKVRAHFFQRLLYGLWACLDPKCSVKPAILTEGGWGFGNVYTMQKEQCTCGAPVYELVFCQDCRTPHLLAEESREGFLLQRQFVITDEFELNEKWVSEESNNIAGLRTLQDLGKGGERMRIIAKLNSHPSCFNQTIDKKTKKVGDINNDPNTTLDISFLKQEAEGPLPFCTSCGLESKIGKDFYRANYLTAPFYLPQVIPTILEYCPDAEENDSKVSPVRLPARGRRLITFTDSRQNTARHAVKMQQDAERSRTRGAIFEDLQRHEPEPNELLKRIQDLKETIPEETYAGLIQSFKDEEKTRSWRDIRTSLEATTDFSHHIRKSNRGMYQGESEVREICDLLLTRELMRRPKFDNNLETLGIVKTDYPFINQLEKSPDYWEKTTIIHGKNKGEQLTLEDWKDFLYICLDFYIRANTAVQVDYSVTRWLGSRSYPIGLIGPESRERTDNKIKQWPQVNEKQNRLSILPRLLVLVTGLDHKKSEERDTLNSWLKAAWHALVREKNLLVNKEGGKVLNLESMHFSLVEDKAWLCPVTNNILARTFQGLSPYTETISMGEDYLCEALEMPKYNKIRVDDAESEIAKREALRALVREDKRIEKLRERGLWNNLHDSIIEGGFYYRAAEHSAQQMPKTLERYEAAFKSGNLNVLNCSTTMEMGVDIGGISAVVMNNLPPHPANYLQRAGRAGRRQESRSIAYTLCNNDPHNLRAFRAPKWAFETPIAAPNIALSSSKIVQRHVNALLLSIFLNNFLKVETDNTKLNLHWFYFEESDDAPANQFLAFLRTTALESEKIAEQLHFLVRGTKLETAELSAILEDSATQLAALQRLWLNEYAKINNKIDQVNKTRESQDRAYLKALEIEKIRHEREYLLKALSAQAFLPVHGFPTNITALHTMNLESYKELQQNRNRADNLSSQDREDSLFSFKGNPTRNLSVALQEYAPGSEIVMDGRVYKSEGISLEWQKQGEIKEEQRIDLHWQCGNCGDQGIIERAYTNASPIFCRKCGSSVDDENIKKLLTPAGFRVDFYAKTHNDVSYREYIPSNPPAVILDEQEVSLPENKCGYIRFGHTGEIIYSNSGKYGEGFAICYQCGRAESVLPENSHNQQSGFRAGEYHAPLGGGKNRADFEKNCSNETVWEGINLGYSVNTDVFELVIKNPLSGEYLVVDKAGNNEVIARTIAVALRDIFAESLGIAAKEMGFGLSQTRDSKDEPRKWVIQIFDNAAGGAGFVTTAALQIDQHLLKLTQKLTCVKECQSACPFCLSGSDNFVERQNINRLDALQWLEKTHWVSYLSASLKGLRFYPGTVDAFIAQNLGDNNELSNRLVFYLPESNVEYAFDHPKFKQKLFQWKYEGLDVQVALPETRKLSGEERKLLAEVANYGIKLVTYKNENQKEEMHLALEIVSNETLEAFALYSTSKDNLLPGENWLATTIKDSWLSALTSAQEVKSFSIENELPFGGGDLYIELTREMFSTPFYEGFPKSIRELFDAQNTAFLQEVKEEGIAHIEYFDRYFCSPWYLLLFTQWLVSLGIKPGELESLEIHTLAPREDLYYKEPFKFSITDNWPLNISTEEVVEKWLSEAFSPEKPTDLTFYKHRAELQHGRELRITTKKGNIFTLFFDQGMGFWKPICRYKEDYYLINTSEPENLLGQLYRKIKKIVVGTEGERSYLVLTRK